MLKVPKRVSFTDARDFLLDAATTEQTANHGIRAADTAGRRTTLAVLRLGFHAVRYFVVRHHHEFAGTAGEVCRLGSVRATATVCAREHFTILGTEHTFRAGQKTRRHSLCHLHTSIDFFSRLVQFFASRAFIYGHKFMLHIQLLSGFLSGCDPRI